MYNGCAGHHGGNLDNHLHGPGATVYLPVRQPGGMLAIGDMHASMGDGEVCFTGVEIAGEVTIRVDLLKGKQGTWPVTELADRWVVHGTAGPDFMEALDRAVEEGARLLVDQWGFTMEEAFIFLLGRLRREHLPGVPAAGILDDRARFHSQGVSNATSLLIGAVPMPDPNRWKALAIVCAAFFMTVLDVSIVNVALPSIGESLHFSEANLQWVITAYAITFGGFLLLGGRAADLLGRRRVFFVGVIVFTIASFLCGLAWSEGVLIAARAVQGLGAAIISPAALSIIMTTFDEGAERNKALGIWGAIGGSGAAVGVLAGGVLTKYLGWEWIFFVNVPVGALALVLAPRSCARAAPSASTTQDDRRRGHGHRRPRAARLRASRRRRSDGWASGATIARLVVAAALLIAFLVDRVARRRTR